MNTQHPTDAEIDALAWDECMVSWDGVSPYEPYVDLRPYLVRFTRAVLAKWGAQQAQPAQPLSDEQIREIHRRLYREQGPSLMRMVRAVEAAHGIGVTNEI